MNKDQLKICIDNIDEYIKGQKRIERKNKILAQSNKLKTIQNQKNQTKIQEEPQVKKQVKKSEKENLQNSKTENQLQIPKAIPKKSKIQQFLEEIHLKILPFSTICQQIEKFYQFKNKVTEESANRAQYTCVYKPIFKQKPTKTIKAQNSITPISTKQTVSIKNDQIKKTPLEFFSFNSKLKRLHLFKEDIQELCEQANGIKILILNKQ